MKRTPTIMVIEDEVLLLQAITNKLSKNGFNIVSCASGIQALDYLANLPELPDVIWLDYYLTDMNGVEFMTDLGKNPKYKDIPVLIVSNSASPDKVEKMMNLGASKYILKAGYKLEEIVEIVRGMVKDK